MHRPARLRWRETLAVWALALLAWAPCTHAQDASFVSARPGWYMSLGALGARLDLDLEVTVAFDALGIDVRERGGGGLLQVGYAFAPGFALELGLSSSEHETGRDDVQARFHQVQLDAVAPLVRHGRVVPYVAGGLGAAGLELSGSGIDDTTISGAQADCGAGVEFLLSTHAALEVRYRFAVQDFREKSIATGTTAGTVDVDARGRAHTWGLRFTWSF